MADQATPEACVHAATEAELAAARQALQEAGPLIAQRGSTDVPEQHCTLAYPSPASGCGCQPPGGSCGTFAAQRFMAALGTRLLGRLLLTAAATASTQLVVQENSAKVPDGLVFVADKQYGGKGRGGNRWESPDGCLMFSAATRLAIPGQRLPFVQYVVSLAVVQAVQAEAALRLQGGSVDVRIKWPNDVYAGGLKLGGILCHSSYRESRFYITMGVGLNMSNRQPTTCLDAVIEQAAAAGQAPAMASQQQQQGHQHQEQQCQEQQSAIVPVSREALLAGILTRLEPMLEQLSAEGFAPFEADYCRHWLHTDQRVQLEEGGQQIPITIRGLSPSGYLLATDERGERYELHPDGNSLDFFAGLVRKKLVALERYSIAFEEEAHSPGFHRPPVKRIGGRGAIPCLALPEGGCVDGSDAILLWIDEQQAGKGLPPLFPKDPAAAAEVTRLCKLFDKDLGPPVRVWAYSHLLYTPEIGQAMSSPPIPWSECFIMRWGGWMMMRRLMATGMRINPENGARKLAVIQRVFGEVDALLADGRPFLAGQTFTAADLTFASLAAPAIGHAYAAAPGLSDSTPAAMREQVEAFRSTAAGSFAMRMWATERSVVLTSSTQEASAARARI